MGDCLLHRVLVPPALSATPGGRATKNFFPDLGIPGGHDQLIPFNGSQMAFTYNLLMFLFRLRPNRAVLHCLGHKKEP